LEFGFVLRRRCGLKAPRKTYAPLRVQSDRRADDPLCEAAGLPESESEQLCDARHTLHAAALICEIDKRWRQEVEALMRCLKYLICFDQVSTSPGCQGGRTNYLDKLSRVQNTVVITIKIVG